MIWITTLTGAGLAVLYLLHYCHRYRSWTKTSVKTGALGLPLVGIAWAGWPLPVVLGLGACVLGDFLLSRPGVRALRAGIVGFATGHVLYVLALVSGGELHWPWGLALALVALGLSTEIWLQPHTGVLRLPVRVYVALILAMGIAAGATGSGLLIAGALAFIASDLLLSVDLFRRPAGRVARVAPFAIWGMYVAAQALLMLGFAP